jgi:hypothetical protein
MTEPERNLPPEGEADLVALADGNLDRSRTLEVEARVAADPVLADALAGQRAALALLATADAVAMPRALRLRVAEIEARGARVRRRLRLWIPAAGAAVAAAIVLMLFTGGGPGVDDVVGAALRPATAEASAREQIDGLKFPTYENWRATGTRSDVIGGRRTRTVFYERDRRQIAYTIVARPALGGGENRRLMKIHGRPAVQWTRDGHTCLISGDVDAVTLINLMEWS